MTFRRKVIELQWFFRTRFSRVLLFGLCLFLVFFVMVYMQDRNRITFSKNDVAVDNPLPDAWKDTDLAGSVDPNTVFVGEELGNYEPKSPEIPSNQPGEGGAPVFVTDEAGLQESKRAEQQYGFNTYVSDMISMNRTIPDIRMEECKHWNYPETLPTVSVVIVFHNEGWTPLLRTVHSVLLRSPPQLIKEIVMVDDYSDKEHLKEKLDKYVKRFDGKVKLVRTEDREGLIRARTIGAKHSTADVVIFLDAHCEVNVNWLPPLLAPIKHNRRVMTVPVIDGIDSNTWEYRSVYGQADRHFSGIFEWGLLYKETAISAAEKNSRPHNSMPFRSPTHAGGLFAIDRLWFQELGYYDEGLQIWGGEQYELSFKIWQCGGGILFVPCSHVGHVYRSHMPYSFGKLSGKPIIATNMLRVIRTWMDEYAEYYFIREPQAQHVDPGDISAQLALKERLHCKPFKWYMEKVAYDVLPSYPIPPKNKVWGEARNPHTGKCLDRMGGIPGPLGANGCHGYGGNQILRLNTEGQLAQGEWCLTPKGVRVEANHCVKGTVNGPWAYDEETGHIIYTRSRTCLTVDKPGPGDLTLTRCNIDEPLQKFVWTEFYQ
uniref:Polypeptide N-acetylgalactosaminyltransferase n=1 Tax=Haemonchus contortus TaxID=6289 RepID=A0A7I4YTK7_HAECO|nr:Glycosyl transferase and Ricin B lectin domain containing protein [Haemonchus contortus]